MATKKVLGTEYLIIGNSAGGIGAAEAIRETDKKNSITIISDETYPSYSRPLISEYLACERTFEEMLFRPVDFYSQNNIDLMLGKTVKSLDLLRRLVELNSGEKITWKKLLLSTGGIPIVPKMKGVNKKGVFEFLTLDDAKAIDKFLKDYSRAVVIGGGLIGVSVSEALTKRGVAATIVEMKDRVLNTILDERASAIAGEVLAESGIRVIVNNTVSEVIGKTTVDGVVLDSGETIPCDLVVIAIGVLPRTELVLGTKIKVNRGIVVDRYMATSYPDVYSCGDVAEAYDFVFGTNRLTPIWPNAYIGGRVAGCNMAGIKTEYLGGTAMNSVNYFGLDITTAGIVNPLDGSNYEVITRDKDNIYQKVMLNNGLIAGMVFVKDIEKSGMIFGLMRERVDVSSFKQVLLTDDFGLAYMPQELWRERLGNVSLLVAKH
jgi:NAD(P)H-nitrite reductase large subunit